MRPFGVDHHEQLRLARSRAVELRSDWQSANGVPNQSSRDEAQAASRLGLFLVARAAAGRTLIGLGQRLVPGESEPCS
jgi:hypothetical protein